MLVHPCETGHPAGAAVGLVDLLLCLTLGRQPRQISLREALGRRRSAAKAKALLGQDARHGRDQSMAAAPLAQQTRHAAGGLKHMVVVGATGEVHAAGDGEVAHQGQPQLMGIGLNGHRETSVELEQIDLRDEPNARALCPRPGPGPGRQSTAQQQCTMPAARMGLAGADDRPSLDLACPLRAV